jgi:tRNA threonylcarbamoyl adenosine modification protein YjeE
MLRIVREIDSLDGTAALARDLAIVLRAGDIVRLDGDLGAGKTTLVRLLARAMGIDPALVSSPTFVVMNLYPGADDRPDVAHLDCYRVHGPDELEGVGWDRLTAPGQRKPPIVLIEWAERIGAALPDHTAAVRIEATGEAARRIELVLPESWRDRPGFGGLETRPWTTCPVTGRRVAPDCPTWPFADERARLADLHGWLAEKYQITRPMEQADLEQGE